MDFDELQAAADLQWLVQCPALIESHQAYTFGAIEPSKPDWGAVKRFLDTKTAHRVGYYVEALVQALLESEASISELQHGLQIRREKETLGELDFLFQQDGKLHHLEVALKLYLCYPEGAENGSHFVGPNATDSFERKRDRLLGKQLPFGREFFPKIEKSQHAVKGMIFYHPSGEGRVPLPELLNPEHARGVWIRESELESLLARWPSHRSGRILKKPFWLAARGEELSVDEIEAATRHHFTKWDGPVYLAGFECGREVERIFVMPECWPQKR